MLFSLWWFILFISSNPVFLEFWFIESWKVEISYKTWPKNWGRKKRHHNFISAWNVRFIVESGRIEILIRSCAPIQNKSLNRVVSVWVCVYEKQFDCTSAERVNGKDFDEKMHMQTIKEVHRSQWNTHTMLVLFKVNKMKFNRRLFDFSIHLVVIDKRTASHSYNLQGIYISYCR